jgi:hypothetical protein
MPEGDLKRKLHRIRPCWVGFTLDNGGLPGIDPEQQLRTPEPSRGEGKARAVRRILRRCRWQLPTERAWGGCAPGFFPGCARDGSRRCGADPELVRDQLVLLAADEEVQDLMLASAIDSRENFLLGKRLLDEVHCPGPRRTLSQRDIAISGDDDNWQRCALSSEPFLYLKDRPRQLPELVGQTNEMLRTLALIETSRRASGPSAQESSTPL